MNQSIRNRLLLPNRSWPPSGRNTRITVSARAPDSVTMRMPENCFLFICQQYSLHRPADRQTAIMKICRLGKKYGILLVKYIPDMTAYRLMLMEAHLQ